MSIKLKGSTAGSVALDAPANTSPSGSDIALTLPIDAGSANEFLKNGSTAGELEYSSMVETSTGVGIGETSPLAKLHVKSGDSGASSVGASADEFVIEGSANTGMTIFSGTTGQGLINFGDSGDVNVGNITYDHNSNFISVKTNDSERARIDSSGNILIGCTVTTDSTDSGLVIFGPSGATLQKKDGTGDHDFHDFYRGSDGSMSRVGNIRTNGSSTSFNTSSDYRLKENVVDLDGAITRVKQLAPKRFNFIVDADTTVDGFLAHEAQTVVPEAVTGTHNEVDDDGNAVMQGIDQSKLVPLLTAALQEAISKIETLETKVAALEAA